MIEHFFGMQKDPGLIPGEEEVIHLNFFQKGNETNGKEQEQEQQLE